MSEVRRSASHSTQGTDVVRSQIKDPSDDERYSGSDDDWTDCEEDDYDANGGKGVEVRPRHPHTLRPRVFMNYVHPLTPWKRKTEGKVYTVVIDTRKKAMKRMCVLEDEMEVPSPWLKDEVLQAMGECTADEVCLYE